MNSKELTGIACRIGPVAALEFAEFERTLEGMEERQRVLLLRGWLAAEVLPKDASLERLLIREVLIALRMEWLKPIYDSPSKRSAAEIQAEQSCRLSNRIQKGRKPRADFNI